MRPTTDKEKVRSEGRDGSIFPVDPGITSDAPLSEREAEVWLEFAAEIIKGFTSNPDLTSNNAPTFITDEACLMADRMLLAYRHRTGK